MTAEQSGMKMVNLGTGIVEAHIVGSRPFKYKGVPRRTHTLKVRNNQTQTIGYFPGKTSPFADLGREFPTITAAEAQKIELEFEDRVASGFENTKARYGWSTPFYDTQKAIIQRGGDPDSVDPKYKQGGWSTEEARKEHKRKIQESERPHEVVYQSEPPVVEDGMMW